LRIKNDPLFPMLFRSRLFLWAVVLVVLVLLVVPIRRPVDDTWGAAVWDMGHLPAFALITYGLARGMGGRSGAGWPAARWVAVAGAVGLAVVSEGMQAYTGRSADLRDLALNGCGIVAAASWAGRSAKRAALRRAVAVAAVVVGLTLALMPAVTQAWAEHRMRAALPDLMALQTRHGRRLWQAQGPAEIRVDSGSGGLRVHLAPGEFGGVQFRAGCQDWSGYAEVVLQCVRSGPPVTLGVRIDDAASAADRVWLSDQGEVGPGRSEIRIPLRPAAGGGGKRAMDLTRVRRLVLFAEKTRAPVDFLLVSAVLRGEGTAPPSVP
jgi:hypothetical protein